jgi:hypothetical protein
MDYTKLSPPEFRKIAQNDDQHGNVLAVVSYDASTKRFFIQAQNEKGDGFITFGPLSQHVFANLIQVCTDIKDMEGRYMSLE